jgi:adenylate kinase family enzyme
MERIVLVGPCGSGKSTLARSLAAALGCPHVELDSLWWDTGWTEAGPARFQARLDAALGDRWVVDGNYLGGGTLEHLWPRADTIVWLDLDRRVTFPRVLKRSAGRVVRRTELWNGNRETVRDLIARDSVLRFAWSSHARTRQRYEDLRHAPDVPPLRWIHLRSPAEVDRWWSSIGAPAPDG